MRYFFILNIIWSAFTSVFALDTMGLNSIYGVDDREFVTNKSTSNILNYSRSVALIVDVDVVQKQLFKTTIKTEPLYKSVNLCLDEKHVLKPSVSNCTGFLIAPDKLVTAGHCFIDESDCATKKMFFDVTLDKIKNETYKLNNVNVFSCKKIISQSLSENLDFAIIQLNKPALSRPFLKLKSKVPPTNLSSSYLLIGHPFGMPQMITKTDVLHSSISDNILRAAFDSFIGNSGSPIINLMTSEVEGVLISGNEDLELDTENECYRYKFYGEVGNEGILKAEALVPFI